MKFKLNDPVWILGKEPAFFENYLDPSHPFTGVRIGCVANGAGFAAVVPTHWVTEREING